jgi:urate oxidase
MDKDMAMFLVSELQKVYNNSLTESFSKQVMNNFVSTTRKLDEIRKEKFQDLYPEFSFPLDFITNEKIWIAN